MTAERRTITRKATFWPGFILCQRTFDSGRVEFFIVTPGKIINEVEREDEHHNLAQYFTAALEEASSLRNAYLECLLLSSELGWPKELRTWVYAPEAAHPLHGSVNVGGAPSA